MSTNAEQASSLTIDIISDVMCPWCYIGQKNLEAARRIASATPVSVRWRPYQLDPTLPPEGKDRATYLNEKFGGEEKAREIYERVRQAGKVAGIDFRFERMEVSPNTLDAHRLIHWAGGQGEDVQNRLVEGLFKLFFEEGANVGDREVLVSAANDAGMDGDLVGQLLERGDDRDAVEEQIAQARMMGVQGVPFFLLAGKYAVSGAQPPEVLAEAIRQVAEREAVDSAS